MYQEPFHAPEGGHFEIAHPSHLSAPEAVSPAPGGEPAVIWLDKPTTDEAPAPAVDARDEQGGLEADPQDVIQFLLKKIDEQQAKLSDQEGYVDLMQQELDQLRGQLQVAREELDRQLADYEVMLQNLLAAEREVEVYKQKAQAKQTIQLPFYAEEKLAKLGYQAAGQGAGVGV
ncbi:MAG: hypothetical protein VKP62_04785 [Candidatus Sericytochromatia bacterium]|nr:hypothetical protein [Candidatus Sericytochromatia bacterium]